MSSVNLGLSIDSPSVTNDMANQKSEFFFRYDYGSNILTYYWCNASANASNPFHRDLRPVYCPTDTYKITTEEMFDGDVVNWNGTKEIMYEQVYTIQWTTVDSMYFMLYIKPLRNEWLVNWNLVHLSFLQSIIIFSQYLGSSKWMDGVQVLCVASYIENI